MTIVYVIIAFAAGILLMLTALSLKNYRRFYLPNWLLRAIGETPWSPGVARHMRAVPNGGLQPTHEVYFVSRQDIAECGLKCEKCGTDVAERGDFSRVTRSIVDGQENEVLKCQGLLELQDGQKPRQCPAWLAASPNTEHGDDLIEGDPPEFYKFSRISQAQALREKYGMEISTEDESLMADPKARPEGSIPGKDIVEASVVVPFADRAEQAQQSHQQKHDNADHAIALRQQLANDETRVLPILTDPPKEP